MDKEKAGVIYKITNLLNNKVYIGQTRSKDGFNGRYSCKGDGIERVFRTLKSVKNSGDNYNSHLYSAINKYGYEAFSVNKEFDIAYSIEELNEKEQYWISFFKATDNHFGYNKLTGGDNYRVGRTYYLNNIGKRWMPVWCSTTREIFLTVSDAAKKYDVSSTSIRRVCIGERKGLRYKDNVLNFEYLEHHTKLIVCLTTGEVFERVTDASRKYGVCRGAIYKNAKGQTKSAGKHPVTKEKLKWEHGIEYIINEIYGRK